MLRRGRALLAATRGVASLEFAVIAPLLFTVMLETLDGARYLLINDQLQNAANSIAQAAEKLSYTSNVVAGTVTSELTADQMQQAMSAIYAEIPGLALGAGTGLFPGQYGVGLSSISYLPVCTAAYNCGAQTPTVVWTTTLKYGGPELVPYFVSCGSPVQVARPPGSAAQVLDMASPVLAGGQAMTIAPQVMASVEYQFTPIFPLFPFSGMVYATAILPAPIGGLNTPVAFNTSGGSTGVTSCGSS